MTDSPAASLFGDPSRESVRRDSNDRYQTFSIQYSAFRCQSQRDRVEIGHVGCIFRAVAEWRRVAGGSKGVPRQCGRLSSGSWRPLVTMTCYVYTVCVRYPPSVLVMTRHERLVAGPWDLPNNRKPAIDKDRISGLVLAGPVWKIRRVHGL